MEQLAVQKAKIRLQTLKKAVEDLSECSNHDEFVGIWYTFLVAAKGIYTTLQQGAKVSPQSKQWFGAKSAVRRGDELLQYLYQARNSDEHGIGAVTKPNPGRLHIGVAKPGYSDSIVVNGTIGPGGIFSVRSADERPVLIEETPAYSELVPVMGRAGEGYPVPTQHLGVPLASQLPIPVAQEAVKYFESLIAEAAAL